MWALDHQLDIDRAYQDCLSHLKPRCPMWIGIIAVTVSSILLWLNWNPLSLWLKVWCRGSLRWEACSSALKWPCSNYVVTQRLALAQSSSYSSRVLISILFMLLFLLSAYSSSWSPVQGNMVSCRRLSQSLVACYNIDINALIRRSAVLCERTLSKITWKTSAPRDSMSRCLSAVQHVQWHCVHDWHYCCIGWISIASCEKCVIYSTQHSRLSVPLQRRSGQTFYQSHQIFDSNK